jgi:hypothetical protein
MRSATNCTLVFTGPYSPGHNVARIDEAPELRQVASPPLVHACHTSAIDRGLGVCLVSPPSPIAIKRVHTVGHIDARIHKCDSGHAVFGLKIDPAGHTLRQARG